MYEKFKEFMVEKEFEQNGKRHVFYPVKQADITEAEERMKLAIPAEIKTFYAQVGYGYFEDKDECFIDLLMNPKRIADFRCGEGDYFYAEEREFLMDEDFVFFEADANCHIYLKVDGEDKGKVFLGKRMIAAGFQEFVERVFQESNYFFSQD